VRRAGVSIKDVATAAGVSVGTVSNVLNRPASVAEPTRRRVQSTITRLGFVRNESARQLRAGRSRTIGMLVLDVANPFFTDMARGVEDVAAESGLAVMLCNSDEDAQRENAYLDLLAEQRVQGVLITPVEKQTPRLDRLRGQGTPVVLLDRPARSEGQCSVAVDDVLGGEQAMTHLLEQGHRRTAFAGGPPTMQQVGDRLTGAQRAVGTHAADATLTVLETSTLNVASGRAAGEQLMNLPSRTRPTAVFCANDLLALGLLQEMTRRGVRVPQDVAIVGYDDIDFAAAAAVPLSSVRQPRHLLGRAGAELLLEEATATSGHEHRQLVFDPELVVRESSRHRRRARSRTQSHGRTTTA
jgi:LacI family transcriptional regulator